MVESAIKVVTKNHLELHNHRKELVKKCYLFMIAGLPEKKKRFNSTIFCDLHITCSCIGFNNKIWKIIGSFYCSCFDTTFSETYLRSLSEFTFDI